MTPKEKAIELVNNMFNKISDGVSYRNIDESYAAKQCALIAVDEIIKSIKSYDNTTQLGQAKVPYWEKVKQEIQNF